jgi:hypothetical protein
MTEFSIQTRPLPRSELIKFLPSPRAVQAFEDLTADVSQNIPGAMDGIIAGPIVTFQASDVFTNERILTGSADIDVTIATDTASLFLSNTGVSGGPYGSASTIATFTVDAKGRLTNAGQVSLVSDNVAEGVTNLFFTNARARSALSAGAGVSYVAATGIISVQSAGAYASPTGTASRATFATYSAPTISNPPTQAEVQAIAAALQVASQHLKALIDDLKANGNLS